MFTSSGNTNTRMLRFVPSLSGSQKVTSSVTRKLHAIVGTYHRIYRDEFSFQPNEMRHSSWALDRKMTRIK